MAANNTWLLFALGSAFFAALTAIFGKLGVSDINSNMATFIRTLRDSGDDARYRTAAP